MYKPSADNFDVEFEYEDRPRKPLTEELAKVDTEDEVLLSELTYDISSAGYSVVKWKKVRKSDGKLHAHGITLASDITAAGLPSHLRTCTKHPSLSEL